MVSITEYVYPYFVHAVWITALLAALYGAYNHFAHFNKAAGKLTDSMYSGDSKQVEKAQQEYSDAAKHIQADAKAAETLAKVIAPTPSPVLDGQEKK